MGRIIVIRLIGMPVQPIAPVIVQVPISPTPSAITTAWIDRYTTKIRHPIANTAIGTKSRISARVRAFASDRKTGTPEIRAPSAGRAARTSSTTAA